MSLTENKMFVVSNSDEFGDAIFMTEPPPLFFPWFSVKNKLFHKFQKLKYPIILVRKSFS